mgnify:CR=1 FL=1
MLEVVGVVEHGVDLRIAQGNLRIVLEVLGEEAGAVAAMFPDLHGVALDGGVAVLAAVAGLGEGEKDALLAAVNDALQELRDGGEYQTIYGTYFTAN